MKKLLAILLCVVVFLCVGVACTDQNKQGNKNNVESQIVGTWVGISEDNSAKNYYERHFWAEIKKTDDKAKPFTIEVYEISKIPANKSVKLPGGLLYFNKVKNSLMYDSADLSIRNGTVRDYYTYAVTMSTNDKFSFEGKEIDKSNQAGIEVTSKYIFERSKLTLEEYENQVKNKA